MVALRDERAKLLGFANFADYRLDDQMAKTPAAARELLDNVWARARAKAATERDALQAMIAEEGGNFALAPGIGGTTPRSCARRGTISTRLRSNHTSNSTR